MKNSASIAALCILYPLALVIGQKPADPLVIKPAAATEPYEPGPDAARHDGVPQGKVIGPLVWQTKAYPGTSRQYWVYVPAQYDSAKPACLMVFQDGLQYLREDGLVRAPIVFDNLIQGKEMPVTIAVFVNPGYVEGEAVPDAKNWNTPSRTVEYDTLGDQYARFLIDELLPAVLKDYQITSDPTGHAICGASSGGICAFTAAWERPDYFRKVISHIGSFTNIRGGQVYPDKIRAAERKPIRTAIQDGAADHNEPERTEDRNWVLQNRRLVEALKEKGYDYRYDFGVGGHSLRHGGAIFPDELRWLWRDYSGTPPEAAAVPFGTPGTTWEVKFDEMSQSVTFEFLANGIYRWVEYDSRESYEMKDGKLITRAPSEEKSRYRLWEINGNTFTRNLRDDADPDATSVTKGTIKRIK